MADVKTVVDNFKTMFDAMSAEEQFAYLDEVGFEYIKKTPESNIVASGRTFSDKSQWRTHKKMKSATKIACKKTRLPIRVAKKG